VRIFRAWFIAGMVALFSGNWLAGASFFWVLGGYCLGRIDEYEQHATDEEEFDEDSDTDWEVESRQLGWQNSFVRS
jgi:hypothetical protein